MVTFEVLFWASALLLAFTYAGYPLWCWLLGQFPRRLLLPGATQPDPSVSVILAVHNEQDRIVPRLGNLLASGLGESDEILVLCDGCTDATAALVRSLGEPRVHVTELPRGGKAAALNHGVPQARGEVIVFCDARQTFAPDAIARLLGPFADPTVGAVSGNLEIEPSESGAGRGVDLYWRLEKFVRRWESAFDSAIGCTGAIYAIRRVLFEPLPPDTILDDVVIPMRIASRGYRVLFDPSAVAFEPQRLDPDRERRRKTRTLAGNYQMLFRYPGWLLPWKSRLWFQLLSHKYLRLAGMPLLLLCLVSTIVLAVYDPFYRAILVAQSALLLLAFLGLVFRKAPSRLLTVPAGFLFLQWTSVEALVFYLRLLRERRRNPSAGAAWK